MARYWNSPDERCEEEIQRRNKIRMYFDALMFLGVGEITNNNNIYSLPLPDPNTALCNLCKMLTDEDMKKIPAAHYQVKWPYKTLFDWYYETS